MIYCNLKGGLANMMFQIAGTYAIAKDSNTDFTFPNFNYHLKFLNDDNFYNPKLKTAESYKEYFSKEIYENIIPLPRPPYNIKRYPFHFEGNFTFNNHTLIDGFFQSEKYFIHHRENIIKLFTTSKGINCKYLDYFYPSFNVITSIHVRRGDYVNHQNHHPVQSLDYYNEAISLLDEETDYFFIFSDDIPWCKENFKGDKYIFVEGNSDYEDLILMSNCNNNIIANSSFSWWGAWLNQKENKKVIGPKKWFGPAITHNDNDIIPKSWMKI